MLLASRLQVSAEPERQHLGGIHAFAVRLSEVARSVAVDHAGNASGLRIIAFVTLKLLCICSDAQKLCEVTARGIACDTNPVGINLINAGICLQPSNSGFHIENGRWELVFWREAVTRRHRDISTAGQLEQEGIIGVAVARAKAAAVNAKHAREQVIGIFWARDVELQMLVVRIGILDSGCEQDVLGNMEVVPGSSELCDRRAQERSEESL